MPLFILAITGWHGEQLAFGTFLTRITFPYLLLISLVSLFSGILNSIARFTAAAFAPALLNLAMLAALIFFRQGGAISADRGRIGGHGRRRAPARAAAGGLQARRDRPQAAQAQA